LLAGPVNTKLPVLLCGDFNCDPLNRDGSLGLADQAIRGAGFGDAWGALHNFNEGLTWGHDADLADPTVLFDRRIDFVFYRGGFTPAVVEVIDAELDGDGPLWASDHAAVSAAFR